MEVEGAERNGSLQVPLEVPSKSLNEIITLKKKKMKCQEITTNETDIKILETQLAVAHDWNGIAHDKKKTKDLTQRHHQMREYLMDMLIQQRKIP
ncbi:hypothetical protein CEXT_398201 [Caerostris extrusa]|uniref:Uncharacterized protein n=1 Tax=Caerostris extrusa TaxID=172846 RepID=A0AAV4NK74_CAEEX|nr:hypothetical protein CEXT_398201 [Caerostris extrusa]